MRRRALDFGRDHQRGADRTDIVAVVGRHVTLKKAGTLYKGLCPFHEEKTPSFTVSPTRNTYHCFGCGAHGDCFRFVVETENRTFPEAVRQLAESAGVHIPEERPLSPAKQAERQEKKDTTRRLLDLQDKLCAFYTAELFSERGKPAQRYLAERGIERRTAEAFRLGYASGDKIAFAQWVEQHDVDREDLVALGVLLRPDEGWSVGQRLWGGYLRFRERVMFPVVDLRGEVVGFSGRILTNDKKTAKYINSPETPVFTKGEQLYGAYTARTAARRAGRVVLVEGNVDVVMLWQAGLEGTVAPMGTALTDKQVRLVARLAESVVCVMDGDAAGNKAAYASLEPFLDAGIQPRAVMLPDGDDPDSFVRREGIEAFQAEIDRAPPLLDLFIERAAASHPPDLQGRVAALRAIAPALARLDDPLAGELYRARVSTLLEVPPRVVASAIDEAAGAAEPEPRRSAARPPRLSRPGRATGPRLRPRPGPGRRLRPRP
ncbi:MAG: DNA primase [Myxococcales bacterium]|nr:DNA primase [Myxococcales bacterium]